MKIPDELEVDGDPKPGEDPNRWVVHLLKGLYGIKQGPCIWALDLHSILIDIGFERTDCDYSVYLYERGSVSIMMLIHVNDHLLASNSKPAIQNLKAELSSHFMPNDQGPAASILGMKLERDRAARSTSLSHPGYVESIVRSYIRAHERPGRSSRFLLPLTLRQLASLYTHGSCSRSICARVRHLGPYSYLCPCPCPYWEIYLDVRILGNGGEGLEGGMFVAKTS